MNKKSEIVLYSFFILTALLFVEIGYLHATKSYDRQNLDTKRLFVKSVALPDLAISTEATYIRHRSLSDFFSIYKDDGALREYFTSTYVFSSADKE